MWWCCDHGMMQSYLRKKFLRSSLFFLTPLFRPQWGKLNTTRSNRWPCREAHSPSFVQSTSNSTVPPERTNSVKDSMQKKERNKGGGGHNSIKLKIAAVITAGKKPYQSPWWSGCYQLRLRAAVPPPDAAGKWPLRWSLIRSTTDRQRPKRRSSLLPPLILPAKETYPR